MGGLPFDIRGVTSILRCLRVSFQFLFSFQSELVFKLDELDWPSLEARRDQSSLLLFHKIHCGAVSIEKDKYMTPAHSLKTTRSSHSAQYRRHQTYSDALKNSFFPRTIPHWNSLPPSVANAQSTEEFRALLI